MAKRVPLISVVVPLYNGAEWIVECIDSIVAQTFTDFEIVVVDDGSTDNGPDLVRSYSDPRIRLVCQSNRGLAGARNSGIRDARGRFIALLDADDLWHPHKLSRHVIHLMSRTSVGVSFSHSAMIDEQGRSLGLTQAPRTSAVDPETIFCRNPVGNGSSPVLRRTALDAACFRHPERRDDCWFDETFRQSEDIELWTRMALQTSCRFEAVPLVLTSYRVRAGALSANIQAQLATWFRFRAKTEGYAPEFVARVGKRAEAYQLRYLARRAVQNGDRAMASELIRLALRANAAIIWEEPARTLTTLLATLLPSAVVQRLPALASLLARRAPKRLAILRL